MTTITDKLAQALRAALTDLQAISDAREGSHGKTCDLAIDALAAYDALAQRDGETLESFVAQIARLKTDDEMDGDMSGDDAVSTLSDLIEGARGFAAYDAQRNASAAPAGAHTPEPWRVGGLYRNGYRITGPDRMIHVAADIVSDDDARRIVACVNACAGFTTEALESLQPQKLFFLWDEWENQ